MKENGLPRRSSQSKVRASDPGLHQNFGYLSCSREHELADEVHWKNLISRS